MITETLILEKLNTLQSAYNGSGSVLALFTPVSTAVTTYFTQGKAKLTHDIQYTICQLMLDIQNRKTVYEHQNLMPSAPTNYPAGYEDVRTIFTAGGALESIMNITPETFNKGYTYTAGTEKTAAPISNSYLNEWKADIETARDKELAGLTAISSFCESGSYNSGLASYFESLGKVVSSIGKDEMAERIFKTGGYKEIIQRFGLDVHIPTSVR